MRAGLRRGALFVLFGVAASLVAAPAHAHEKWFLDSDGYGLRWDLFFGPLPLALVGAALLVTLIAGFLWRARGRGFVPGPEAFGAGEGTRALFYGLVPLILGVHVAVPLLVNGVQGNLFSPDNEIPGVWSNLLGFAETMIALSLFYGAFTRVAASGLAALWVAGLFLLGVEPMLDNLLYLGFAAFFFLAGRGPYSVDRLLLPRLEPPEHLARYALPAARVGLGASFVVVAFTEKLANLPLGLAFLEEYPLNFAAGLGLPIPDSLFVLGAGTVELLVGLWLLLGIFPREIVLIALVPTNLTLTVFNWSELIGHLPIYGLFAVLLLWGSGKDLPLFVRGMREGPKAPAHEHADEAPAAAPSGENGRGSASTTVGGRKGPAPRDGVDAG